MRLRHAVVVGFALVAFALAPLALAGGACLPQCDILTNDFAFAPATVALASGATVTWTVFHSITPSHTATSADRCLNVAVSERAAGAGTFAIVNGQLVATTIKGTNVCTGATALPDGSFVLPYVCNLHAQMVGQLVVSPEVPS